VIETKCGYNRRVAIIESLRAEHSAMEILRFFRYPRSTVYDVVAKYTALEQSKESNMPAKSHSKERSARTPAVVERAQTLISDEPGKLLRKLASIVGIKGSQQCIELPRRTFDTNRHIKDMTDAL